MKILFKIFIAGFMTLLFAQTAFSEAFIQALLSTPTKQWGQVFTFTIYYPSSTVIGKHKRNFYVKLRS